MARKKQTGEEASKPLPNLTRPRAEVESVIDGRIAKGTELLQAPLQTDADVDKAEADYYKWDEYNTELLRRLFTTSEVSAGYSFSFGGFIGNSQRLHERINDYQRDVQYKVRKLERVKEQLPLYEEPAQQAITGPSKVVALTNKVFVVHGRDDGVKETVARFLSKLDLEPVILHEQPNKGRTIIEKFVDSSSVAFAVVLLTPDDVGSLATEPDKLAPRARQNVVFELGYFLGKLGREKVCALLSGNVEEPSDFGAVVYLPLDAGGAWRLLLARELRAAGLDVDLNRAI